MPPPTMKRLRGDCVNLRPTSPPSVPRKSTPRLSFRSSRPKPPTDHRLARIRLYPSWSEAREVSSAPGLRLKVVSAASRRLEGRPPVAGVEAGIELRDTARLGVTEAQAQTAIEPLPEARADGPHAHDVHERQDDWTTHGRELPPCPPAPAETVRAGYGRSAAPPRIAPARRRSAPCPIRYRSCPHRRSSARGVRD